MQVNKSAACKRLAIELQLVITELSSVLCFKPTYIYIYKGITSLARHPNEGVVKNGLYEGDQLGVSVYC